MKKIKRLVLLSLLLPCLLTDKKSFTEEENRKVETVELKEVKEETSEKIEDKKEEKTEEKNKSKEKVVYKFTSQAEAEKIIGKLKAGKKYILREIKAPEGYKKSKDIEFIVREDGVDKR